MKIVIVSGGTGGHIYPGIAIAQEIKKRDPQSSILFLGSREGLENKIIPKEGYSLKLIKARALLRKFSYKALTAPFISAIGFFQSLWLLKRFSPNFLISTGGYVSLPAVTAAKLLRVPIILHEQNALPGAVNRICSFFANKIFLYFPESKKYIKGEVVGNPVRKEIIEANKATAQEKFGLNPKMRIVLVMGGSQGAKQLNEIVVSSLDKVPSDIFILHIIGDRDFGWAQRYLEGKQLKNYRALPYLYAEMAHTLAAADLVVSRAGATAIAEFTIWGLPMILVPFPFAAENHQQLNAEAVAQNGAAIIIKEKDLTPQKFISLITNSAIDYDKMKKASLELAKPKAAERIVDYIYA